MKNLTREMRKAPLQSGVYCIEGPQGVGKTSLAAALLCTDYRRHRKWRVKEGRALARRYQEDSDVRLQVSENPYFSNNAILLDKRRKVYTNAIDVQRLGLPNDDYAVQYLPRASVVFIQEADLQLFCRDFKELNAYLVALLKFVRHNLITVIFDCQVFDALDKAVRRLITGRIHVTESFQRRFFLFWKPQYWRFIFVDSQLNEALKDLAEIGMEAKNIAAARRGKFRFFGKVFERFDSFAGMRYFLRGIEEVGYEYLSHPRTDLSNPSIEGYCEMFPLVKPEETKKNAKEAKEPKSKKELLEFFAAENGMKYCSLLPNGAFCTRSEGCATCPVLVGMTSNIPIVGDN